MSSSEAWAGWFDLHRPRLNRFIARMVGGSDAEDVLQDVIVRVLKSGKDVRTMTGADAWVFTIANNACIDALRKGRPRTMSVPEVVVARSGADATEQEELRRALTQAVEELSEDQRQVFLLREEGGLSFRQIAETLGIPLNTALGRMHYALEKLRKNLAVYR